MMQRDFSVVVPVLNSEKSLQELFERIAKTFAAMGKTFQVIFVDDGSRDGSWKVLSNLKSEHPDKIVAIKLSKNFGQHNAILCGFGFVKGDYTVTIDDDLQYMPEDIAVLYDKMTETDADIIFGVHGDKKHNVIRKIGSWYMNQSSRFSSKTIAGASFRLIKSDIVKKTTETYHEYVYIDEILSWFTEHVDFATVNHLPRKHDHSNYTSGKLITHALNISFFYTAFPLRLMSYGGFAASIIFALIGLHYLLKKLFFHATIGYTSIIVAILFSAAIMLMCMGILGEYMLRIYKAQTKRPPFAISKIL